MAGIVTVLILLGARSSGYFVQNNTIPAQLVGVWRTNSASYAHCYFVLKPKTLVIGRSVGAPQTGTVVRVYRASEGKQVRYKIVYMDEGGHRVRWRLIYDPASKYITLGRRQDIQWTRKS